MLFFALAFEMKIRVAAFQLLVPLICYLIDGLSTIGASGAGTCKHGCNFNLMSLLEISCHRNGIIWRNLMLTYVQLYLKFLFNTPCTTTPFKIHTFVLCM
jgi:hypothetical protein